MGLFHKPYPLLSISGRFPSFILGFLNLHYSWFFAVLCGLFLFYFIFFNVVAFFFNLGAEGLLIAEAVFE